MQNSAKIEELLEDLVNNVNDDNVDFLLVLSGNDDGYEETRKRIEKKSVALKSSKIRITTHQGKVV